MEPSEAPLTWFWCFLNRSPCLHAVSFQDACAFRYHLEGAVAAAVQEISTLQVCLPLLKDLVPMCQLVWCRLWASLWVVLSRYSRTADPCHLDSFPQSRTATLELHCSMRDHEVSVLAERLADATLLSETRGQQLEQELVRGDWAERLGNGGGGIAVAGVGLWVYV